MIHVKKRYIFLLLFVVGAGVAVGFTTIKNGNTDVDIHQNYIVEKPQLATAVAEMNDSDKPEIVPPMIGKSFIGFKEALAYRESRGNYFIVNPYGYVGKYQFGKSALRHYGIDNVDEFLNSPEQQEKLFEVSLQRNKWMLRREINRYAGKWINGIRITESGILAAAHLAGVQSVKNFFKHQGDYFFADANGTTLQNYMKYFAGYDLEAVTAEKEAAF
ncbi:MAG: peptidoglycan-binding protein LysM [Capnocytophaga sp.]|nr:peptidoglycan-binding protein LysM [Capnocytophaga sp.]